MNDAKYDMITMISVALAIMLSIAAIVAGVTVVNVNNRNHPLQVHTCEVTS